MVAQRRQWQAQTYPMLSTQPSTGMRCLRVPVSANLGIAGYCGRPAQRQERHRFVRVRFKSSRDLDSPGCSSFLRRWEWQALPGSRQPADRKRAEKLAYSNIEKVSMKKRTSNSTQIVMTRLHTHRAQPQLFGSAAQHDGLQEEGQGRRAVQAQAPDCGGRRGRPGHRQHHVHTPLPRSAAGPLPLTARAPLADHCRLP